MFLKTVHSGGMGDLCCLLYTFLDLESFLSSRTWWGGTGGLGFHSSPLLLPTTLKWDEAWAGESADLGHASALPFLGCVTLDKSFSLSLKPSCPFCETETRRASEHGCGSFVS